LRFYHAGLSDAGFAASARFRRRSVHLIRLNWDIMDTITFIETKDAGAQILINGRDLREIVRAVELPFAAREGSPQIAGAYSGLPAEIVFLPSRHMLGEPQPLYSDGSGRTQVLECECGEPGCWPLTVRIDIHAQEVVWRDFHQPHRGVHSTRPEWRYDTMPEYRFDRESYEQALSTSRRKAE
jgi:hypothetical protein